MEMNRMAYSPSSNEKESKPNQTELWTVKNVKIKWPRISQIWALLEKCALWRETKWEAVLMNDLRLANFLMMCHRWNFDVFFTSYKHWMCGAKFVHDVSWMWSYRLFNVRSNKFHANSMHRMPMKPLVRAILKWYSHAHKHAQSTLAASEIRLNLYEVFSQPQSFSSLFQHFQLKSKYFMLTLSTLYFHQSSASAKYTNLWNVWQLEYFAINFWESSERESLQSDPMSKLSKVSECKNCVLSCWSRRW